MKNADSKDIKLPEEAYQLYDQYAHGMLSRRDFFTAMGGLAVNAAVATTLINSLLPNYALAQQVSFNDDDIVASYQVFPSPDGHGEGAVIWSDRGMLKAPWQRCW
jgi:carboxymethylenebutenolidase